MLRVSANNGTAPPPPCGRPLRCRTTDRKGGCTIRSHRPEHQAASAGVGNHAGGRRNSESLVSWLFVPSRHPPPDGLALPQHPRGSGAFRSGMRQIRVDAGARKACFGGGCLLGTIDQETQRFGLAFPAGVVSHTGAGGLVLGGGTGWLSRLYGLSCDNVEAFTMVAADGSVVRADAQHESDLFWALRGGGGNFGIVTEFEVKLHPIRSVVFGKGLCAVAGVPDLLRHWREYMTSAPDQLRWSFSLRIAPETETIPAELRGKPVASASALWLGVREEGLPFVRHALTAEPHHAVAIEELLIPAVTDYGRSGIPAWPAILHQVGILPDAGGSRH